MLKASGKYLVGDDFIKISLDRDFCRYYKWLFDKAHWKTIKTQAPKHGAHINVCNPKLHKNVDCRPYKGLNGKNIEFGYDIGGNYGGFTRGFLNFWLDVYSPELEDIARNLGVLKPREGFAYFHITILNTKNI